MAGMGVVIDGMGIALTFRQPEIAPLYGGLSDLAIPPITGWVKLHLPHHGQQKSKVVLGLCVLGVGGDELCAESVQDVQHICGREILR